ncbi:MAG: hypothetical protein RIQ51_1813, partial [Bacteroidota bacterium]
MHMLFTINFIFIDNQLFIWLLPISYYKYLDIRHISIYD